MMWKYFLGWFGMLVLAFTNGAFRQAVFLPLFGDLAAHQISSATLIALYLLYFRYLNKRWKMASSGEAWLIGVMWLVLTVGFEFGFGHFVFGTPWSRLMADYDLAEGRVWTVVLLAIVTGPSLFFVFAGKEAQANGTRRP